MLTHLTHHFRNQNIILHIVERDNAIVSLERIFEFWSVTIWKLLYIFYSVSESVKLMSEENE